MTIHLLEIDNQTAVQEATLAGIKSMDHLIRFLSYQNQHDCGEITDLTVSKYKQVISILNRTGHARFRRAPSNPPVNFSDQSQSQPKPVPPPSLSFDSEEAKEKGNAAGSELLGNQTSSFQSSLTGDSSFSSGKHFRTSSGKPPLPTSHRKKCRDNVLSSATRCHCSKARRSRFKKIVRVQLINSKIPVIPSDEYSWRKYGQKPIKGSPYTRGCYGCSSVRGCPARKHVERARDNPTLLIVTYEGEHRHYEAPSRLREAVTTD